MQITTSFPESEIGANINHCMRRALEHKIISNDDVPENSLVQWCDSIIQEGLGPFLYPYLSETLLLPSELKERIRTSYRSALLYKDFCIQKLSDMQDVLSRCGRIVLIQGFGLLEYIYPEPLCRSMSDIDLFLPDKNSIAVREILYASGFRQYGRYSNVWRYKDMCVDIHEDLWGADRVTKRSFFAPKEQIQFKESTLIPGFYVLSDTFCALYTVFHALKHGLSKKAWIIDIALLYKQGYFQHVGTIDTMGIVQHCLTRLSTCGFIAYDSIKSYDTLWGLWRHSVQKITLEHGKMHGMGEMCLAFSIPSFFGTVRYFCSSIVLSKRTLQELYGNYPYGILLLLRFWSVFVKKLFISS